MAEQYSFFNSKDHDRVYNARHWADYFYPLFKSGVFNGGLAVTANDNMTATIAPGYAWIDGYAYHLTEPLTVDLETASGNMNRIDNIVVQLDLSNRWIKALTVTGNYYSGAATAKEPEITATIHDLIIARVNVAAGTTAITQDMIKDTRMNDELCGWVCGAVQQISFAQITAQFDAFFAAYKADVTAEYAAYLQNIASLETQAQTRYDSMDEEFTAYEQQQKAAFEAWVESIKDILDGNAAGNLLLLINEKMQKVTVGAAGGVAYLEIEDGLNLALAGFTACDTTFNVDGTITQTDKIGNVKTTTFVSKQKINEEYVLASGDRYTKTTTFGSNSITERIVKNE